LAQLTHQLYAEHGGLDGSSRACRLKKTRLAECQDHTSGASLPVDVVNQLELACGKPIISRALMEDCPLASRPDDLTAEACGTVEAAAGLQRLVRLALLSNDMTPRKARAIEIGLLELVDHVRATHAALLERERVFA
jgi:hypothetical protein